MTRSRVMALVVAAIVLAMASAPARAWDPLQKAKRAAGKGQQLLAGGDSHGAVESLLRAQALAPEDPAIRLGLGEALYSGGDYATAMTQYQGAAEALGGEQARDALYNAGNAAFKRKDYQRALGLYQQALLEDSPDPDLVRNLELTQKLIEQAKQQQKQQDKQDQQQDKEQDKQQQQQKQQQDQQQQGQQGQDQQQQEQQQEQQKEEQEKQDQQQEQPKPEQAKPDSSQAPADTTQALQPPPGMTPQEAMRLLGALDHDEEQLRRSIQRRLRGDETRNARDW